MEHGWKNGRDMLTSRDVLVIDEAGMVARGSWSGCCLMPPRFGAKVVLGRRSAAVAIH
jgi:hypothetical protein